MRCYCCGGERHRATECMSRMPEGHRREGQQGRRIRATNVELLDMKLETAVLRCVINRPCPLDPLEVNYQGLHNEWDALCMSEMNCRESD